jgi:excisionase family DNA binding protein
MRQTAASGASGGIGFAETPRARDAAADDLLDLLSPSARRALEALVARLVEDEVERRVQALLLTTTPYMTVPEAAEYMRCRRQRVDDLLSAQKLERYKDGRRTLVSRAEVEAYLCR